MKIKPQNSDQPIETNPKVSLIYACWDWISTHFITIIIAIALFFVFLYFENEIVEKAFSFFGIITSNYSGSILLWVLWGLLLAAIITVSIRTIKNKTLSDGRTYFFSIALCSLFIYCITRYPWEMSGPIVKHDWTFLVLFILFGLYSLIIPVFLFFKVEHNSVNYRLDPSKTNQGYLSDNPINSMIDDDLMLNNHIETLKDRIDKIPISGTHSIAITGGWGKGKTSFLKLLQQELLSKDEYEVIWFNPMKSSKSDNIQKDFFDLFESSLSKYKTGLGRRFKYYKELIGAIDNKYLSFLIKLASIQLKDEKERINDIIKKIPKRVIIIIDDMDRLKGEEIIQVFRLVGYNAEFDNVVYLLALDKANVITTLNCNKNYPDKFIETEFPLPEPGKYFTVDFVKKNITEAFGDNQTSFLNEPSIIEGTAYCIDTLRDAKRFLNNFIDRARMISGDLDLRSYYLLSLIHYKDLFLYEQIKNQVFLEKDNRPGEDCLKLINFDSFNIDGNLIPILNELFPQNNTSSSERCIFQTQYFYDYFNESSTKRVTDPDMMKLLITESEKELIEKLQQYTIDDIKKKNIEVYWKNHNIQGTSFYQLQIDYLIKVLQKQKMNPEEIQESINRQSFVKLVFRNYYRIYGYLKLDNGLTYHDNLALIMIGPSNYAYINTDGIINLEIECAQAYPFSDGLALIKNKEGKYGFIDTKGGHVIDYQYDNAFSFAEELACVKKAGKWGFIDKNNNPIIGFQYDVANPFNNGMAIAEKDNYRMLIDKKGDVKYSASKS